MAAPVAAGQTRNPEALELLVKVIPEQSHLEVTGQVGVGQAALGQLALPMEESESPQVLQAQPLAEAAAVAEPQPELVSMAVARTLALEAQAGPPTPAVALGRTLLGTVAPVLLSLRYQRQPQFRFPEASLKPRPRWA